MSQNFKLQFKRQIFSHGDSKFLTFNFLNNYLGELNNVLREVAQRQVGEAIVAEVLEEAAAAAGFAVEAVGDGRVAGGHLSQLGEQRLRAHAEAAGGGGAATGEAVAAVAVVQLAEAAAVLGRRLGAGRRRQDAAGVHEGAQGAAAQAEGRGRRQRAACQTQR